MPRGGKIGAPNVRNVIEALKFKKGPYKRLCTHAAAGGHTPTSGAQFANENEHTHDSYIPYAETRRW